MYDPIIHHKKFEPDSGIQYHRTRFGRSRSLYGGLLIKSRSGHWSWGHNRFPLNSVRYLTDDKSFNESSTRRTFSLLFFQAVIYLLMFNDETPFDTIGTTNLVNI
jgi:hypothetical protein